MGCEPSYDCKWLHLDVKVIVEFEVSNVNYKFLRYKNTMRVFEEDKEVIFFDSISGDYAKYFAKIVKFNLLLPKRNENKVVIPPPAYYFSAFYIDQRKSWSTPWDCFDGLGQFSSWKKEVVECHVGIASKETFELINEIYSKMQSSANISDEIDRINSAATVVNEFATDIPILLDEKSWDEAETNLNEKLSNLYEIQERVIGDMSSNKAEIAHNKNQLAIARKSIVNLHGDYEYALTLEDDLECPTCGTLHDNTLVERFSLLTDKQQAEDVENDLKKLIFHNELSLNESESELLNVREKSKEINKKLTTDGEKDISSILQSVAVKTIKKEMVNKLSLYEEKLSCINKEKAEAQKRRTALKKDLRKEVNTRFIEMFTTYLTNLKAFVSTEKIQSPVDYSKVGKSGGGAEGPRALLAYYVSIYNLVWSNRNEVIAPLIIDTPNQQEQSDFNYDLIIKLLAEKLPNDSQIFLCGMENQAFTPLSDGKKINLTGQYSLLLKENYTELSNEVSQLFN